MPEKSSVYDVVFLYTGSPLPAMLDMVIVAKAKGLRPKLILLDRGENDLVMDSSLIDYDVEIVSVAYKGAELRRVLSLPRLWLKLDGILRNQLADSGMVVTNTLDTLFVVFLSRLFRKFDIRHQIRDLHSLQLKKGALPSVVRTVEKILMKRVSLLTVSSMEFYNSYYAHIYSGEVLLLENVPLQSVWHGFRKSPRQSGTLTIGYIGILRYKKSVFQLIDAVESLSNSGMDIKVVFAGGSVGSEKEEVKARITKNDLFEFSGAYEYARDIKRLYSDIDLIYAVYDAADLNCQLAMPNKYYEAIITKTPLLVAANTYVGARVDEEGIGHSVDLDEDGELCELLGSVANEDSWYNNAQDKLASIDPADMYAEYSAAVSKSVQQSL